MVKPLVRSPESRDIFTRLEDHGIRDYWRVKEIVSFQIPHDALLFARRFGRRSLEDALRQIERWKKFLKTDFILLPEQRAEVERWIVQTETLVCNALIQVNLPRVGDWELQFSWIPTGTNEDGTKVYIMPGLKITARHRRTREIREASISSEALYAPGLRANPYQIAFEELGLWESLEKGSLRRYLISDRKPPGWPLYTRIVVPRLYDFLAPYYFQRGHYSEKRTSSSYEGKALFPRDLLQDMLDILQTEHPHVYEKTTINQLKANIQRHLERKAKSTKPPH